MNQIPATRREIQNVPVFFAWQARSISATLKRGVSAYLSLLADRRSLLPVAR
jgi:hypothetical protein